MSVTDTKSPSYPVWAAEPSGSASRPRSTLSRLNVGAGTCSACAVPVPASSTSQLPLRCDASENEYGSGEPL